MSIPKRLRFEVLRRDNHACRYCGATAPDVKLVVDHVVPESLGGATEPSNLVTACEPCNSGKTSRMPDDQVVADVAQDAMRWSRAMEYATVVDLVDRSRRDGRREAFRDHWQGWTYRKKLNEWVPFDLPLDWPNTIDAMYESGLTEGDIDDAINIAMRREGVDDRFRYFCGVGWGIIKRRRDTAAAILSRATGGTPQEPSEDLICRAVASALDENEYLVRLDPWVYDALVLDIGDKVRAAIPVE